MEQVPVTCLFCSQSEVINHERLDFNIIAFSHAAFWLVAAQAFTATLLFDSSNDEAFRR